MLCAGCSRKAINGLWSDLKTLSAEDLEAELDRLDGHLAAALANKLERPTALKRKGKAKKSAAMPKDDLPATRIAFELTNINGLSEAQAITALSQALLHNGVSASKLPDDKGQRLADWLEALLDHVPGSVVMDAALKAAR